MRNATAETLSSALLIRSDFTGGRFGLAPTAAVAWKGIFLALLLLPGRALSFALLALFARVREPDSRQPPDLFVGQFRRHASSAVKETSSGDSRADEVLKCLSEKRPCIVLPPFISVRVNRIIQILRIATQPHDRRGVFIQMAKPKLRIVKNKPAPATVGKRLRFDKDTWNAIEVLAQDQMKDIPEVVEEAMRDLLRKHGRSADFRQQLRMSAQDTARTEKTTTAQPSGKRKRKRP